MARFVYVINAIGEKEPFSFEKVYRSARKSGASNLLARNIARTVAKEIYSGITTAEIFKKVKKELHRISPGASIAFNLKEGIRKLGPTGFPFEKYIAGILRDYGYKVKINQIIPGACSKYEIDFIAEKENLLYIGECKYHNLPSGRTHLDYALANYARFLDIKAGNFFNRFSNKFKTKSLLVTNTKLTKEAINYSKCVGVKLLGWNYPNGEGLEYLIETKKLYPITILPSLNPYLTNIFASKKIMLAKDLLNIDVEKFSRKEKVPENKIKYLIGETKILLGK